MSPLQLVAVMLLLALNLQAADYVVTTTGNTLVCTDTAGASDTLEMTQPSAGNLQFAAAGKTFSIDGGGDLLGDTGPLDLSNITSITINAGNGNDIINLNGATNIPTLDVKGGSENDTVKLLGNLTFAPGASLRIELTRDSPYTEDRVVVTSAAKVSLSGLGLISISCGRDVIVENGASLETEHGSVYLTAGGAQGDYVGIHINGGTVRSLGTGGVSVNGTGGRGLNGGQFGVLVDQGGSILGGIASYSGISVAGYNGTGANYTNRGVAVTGTGSRISSAGASVYVRGFARADGYFGSQGVSVAAGGEISAGGTGTLSVQGEGGGNYNSSSLNNGIELADPGSKITTDGGSLTVRGKSGPGFPGGAGGSWGLLLKNSASITTPVSGGNITVDANSLSLDATSTIASLSGTSSITFQASQISLGGNDSPSFMGLSVAELERIATLNLTLVSPSILIRTLTNQDGATTLNGAISPNAKGTDIEMNWGGRVSLASGASLRCDIKGITPDTQVPMLKVAGTIDLANATLALTTTYAGAQGNSFLLVDNDGNDPIIGRFKGIAEGDFVAWPGDPNLVGRLTYLGGTGNDVVLTLAGLNPAELMVTNTNARGPGSLANACSYAEAHSGPDRVTFASNLAGRTIRLDQLFVVTADFTMDASNLPGGIICAGEADGTLFRLTGENVFRNITFRDLNASILNVDGNLTLSRCKFANLTGAYVVSVRGALNMVESDFTGNRGYPLFTSGSGSITNCKIIGNEGGALSNAGYLTITYCDISNNGRGLSNDEYLELIDCNISENRSSGVYNEMWSNVIMTNCTLSGNTTTEDEAGGALTNFGNFSMNNCTLTGNSAPRGGAIYNSYIYFNSPEEWAYLYNFYYRYPNRGMAHCTVFGNTATSGQGGGIYQAGADIDVQFTILTGNGESNVFGIPGYWLYGSNLLTGDPKLAPLANNGGYTKTMALLPDSPAINAISYTSEPMDQRGFRRDSRPDIGAYEQQAFVPLPGNFEYQENFDNLSLNSLHFPDQPMVGWTAEINNGATPPGPIQVSAGASNARGLLNLGATGSSDRALGSKATLEINNANISYGVTFRNVGKLPVRLTRLRYAMELWRSGGGAGMVETLTPFYAITTEPLTSLSSGGNNPIAQAGAGFSAFPPGARAMVTSSTANTQLDGNAPGNRSEVDLTLPPANAPIIYPGQYFTLKWTDADTAPFQDAQQGLDDVVLNFTELATQSFALGGGVVGGTTYFSANPYHLTAMEELTMDPGSATLTTDPTPLTPGTEKCFTMLIEASDYSTNAGFEADDTLRVELLCSRPGGLQVIVLTNDFDINQNGFINGGAGPLGDEFNTGTRSGLWISSLPLVGHIAADVTSIQLRITGTISESGPSSSSIAEGFRFKNALISPWADSDGDGVADGWEWAHGTDPAQASSTFRVLTVGADATEMDITLPSVTTRSYQALRSADLLTWTKESAPLLGTGSNVHFRKTPDPNQPKFFWKFLVQPLQSSR